MASTNTIDVGGLLAGGRHTLQIDSPVTLEPFEGWEFPEPARVRMQIRSIDRMLEITGTIDVTGRGQCDRCLGEVRRPMHIEVEERLEPPAAMREDPFGESNVLQGDRLDIADLSRQLVDSSAPFSVLCDEQCRGLCPKCGQNLNDGTCECEGQE